MRASQFIAPLLLAAQLACDRSSPSPNPDVPPTREAAGTAAPTTQGAAGVAACLLNRASRQVLGRAAGYADSPSGAHDQVGLLRPGADTIEWLPTRQVESVACDEVWKLTHEAVGRCAQDRAGWLLGTATRVTGRPGSGELEVSLAVTAARRDSAGLYTAVVVPRQATLTACEGVVSSTPRD